MKDRDARGRKSRTHEEAQTLLDSIHGEGEFVMLTQYQNASKPMLFRHSCGYEWQTSFFSVQNNSRCAGCKMTGECTLPKTREERGEVEYNEVHGAYYDDDYEPRKRNELYPMMVRFDLYEMKRLRTQLDKLRGLPIVSA